MHRSLFKSKKPIDTKNERMVASQRLRADKRRDMYCNGRNVSLDNEDGAASKSALKIEKKKKCLL